jgi:hypothetical protein
MVFIKNKGIGNLRLDRFRGFVLGGMIIRLQEGRVGDKEPANILASCCQ